jgi:hypothetical protein
VLMVAESVGAIFQPFRSVMAVALMRCGVHHC